MRLMLHLFRAYPMASFLMVVALFFSGLAEGLGLSALLPMLKIALYADEGAANVEPPGELEQAVLDVLLWLGIPVTLGALLVLIVVAAFFKAILLLVAQRQVGYTAAQVATDLRLETLRNMMRSRWSFFLHQPAGKLSNALATEAQRAADAYMNGATALTFFIQALVYGTVAVLVSWQATLLSLIGGAVIIWLSHFLVRVTRKAGKKQTELMVSLMSHLTDTLQSVKPLKAMARENLADQLLHHETNRLNKALRRQVLASAGLNSGQDLMFIIVIAFGIYLALGILSMEFATVLILAVTLGRAFNFLGKVQKQYQKLAQSESAYWSLKETNRRAEEEREHLGGHVAPALETGIELRGINFSYDGNPVFTGLDLDIPAHRMTTLVGPSGSGKTTVIDLVIGLLRPEAGTIKVDGVAFEQIELTEWRRMVGYVPQETVLLHDSILHNVTLGDPGMSEGRVEEALKKAGAWDFVSALPEGIHTVVGERGGRLSGGQRQRIAIARALINDPTLLILDEATSALDPESEAAIIKTMRALRDQLTILAITHNSRLSDAADIVHRLGPGGKFKAG
ncbi:ABC transporter ATP-binding protein [uncultured Roseovarius sp.]|uniref:ABC transporter ATP-binding protein n=1 Tax=uncultured Roseovarius sp. TaxID=293344 RepID=UPI00261D97A4|nr:ABC transporter ATP-binding protein [uncultured Roseovarius sp.]